jgi:hypothetical protein
VLALFHPITILAKSSEGARMISKQGHPAAIEKPFYLRTWFELLVSVIVAFITYHLVEEAANARPQPQGGSEMSLVLSILSTIVTTIIFILLEFDYQGKTISREAEASREQNQALIDRYNDALNLSVAGNLREFTEVAASIPMVEDSEIPEAVTKLIEQTFSTLNRVKTVPAAKLFHDELLHKVYEMQASMDDSIRRRFLEYNGAACKRKTGECYEFVDKTVQAVSYLDSKFWVSPNGEQFLQMNEKALERNVRLDRFFLLEIVDDRDYGGYEEMFNRHFDLQKRYPSTYRMHLCTNYNWHNIVPHVERHRSLFYFDKKENNKAESGENRKLVDRKVPDISFFDSKIVSNWNLGPSAEEIDRSRIIVDPGVCVASKNILDELLSSAKLISSKDYVMSQVKQMVPTKDTVKKGGV